MTSNTWQSTRRYSSSHGSPRASGAESIKFRAMPQLMLNEARSLSSFLFSAILNTPITIDINKLSSNGFGFRHFRVTFHVRYARNTPHLTCDWRDIWVNTRKLGQDSSWSRLVGSYILLHIFMRHNVNETNMGEEFKWCDLNWDLTLANTIWRVSLLSVLCIKSY